MTRLFALANLADLPHPAAEIGQTLVMFIEHVFVNAGQ